MKICLLGLLKVPTFESSCCTTVLPFKYQSPPTRRGWAITDYGKTKSQVRELLKNALTSVHLSIDGWTSPQQTMAVLGIVAHFVGANGRLYGIVLGFEELDGPHS